MKTDQHGWFSFCHSENDNEGTLPSVDSSHERVSAKGRSLLAGDLECGPLVHAEHRLQAGSDPEPDSIGKARPPGAPKAQAGVEGNFGGPSGPALPAEVFDTP